MTMGVEPEKPIGTKKDKILFHMMCFVYGFMTILIFAVVATGILLLGSWLHDYLLIHGIPWKIVGIVAGSIFVFWLAYAIGRDALEKPYWD